MHCSDPAADVHGPARQYDTSLVVTGKVIRPVQALLFPKVTHPLTNEAWALCYTRDFFALGGLCDMWSATCSCFCVCLQVPRISPPSTTIEQYKDNYGRINLWAWTEYARIVYIDGDTTVMRDISALFYLPHGITGAVGACPIRCKDDADAPY